MWDILNAHPMAFLPYQDAKQKGDKGHTSRQRKYEMIIAGEVKAQAPEIGPEASAKVVDGADEPCDCTYMRESIKFADQGGAQGRRNEKRWRRMPGPE